MSSDIQRNPSEDLERIQEQKAPRRSHIVRNIAIAAALIAVLAVAMIYVSSPTPDGSIEKAPVLVPPLEEGARSR